MTRSETPEPRGLETDHPLLLPPSTLISQAIVVDFTIRRTTWGEWLAWPGLSVNHVLPPVPSCLQTQGLQVSLKTIHEKTVPVTHQPTPTGFGHCQVPSSHSASWATAALPDKRSRGGGRARNGISRFTLLHCVRPSALLCTQRRDRDTTRACLIPLSLVCDLCNPQIEVQAIYPFHSASPPPPRPYPPPRHSLCISFP